MTVDGEPDDGESGATTRFGYTRRRFFAALGAGTAVVLAGCAGADGDPVYEDGEVEDAEGEGRTAEETVTAEALAEQEVHNEVTPLDAISLADHEFVVEDGYTGPTVQGTVENTGGDRVDLVEVRVRVYDDAGTQLGRYLASTGDLDGGATWRFEVIVLEAPGDVAGYDIAALGTPT